MSRPSLPRIGLVMGVQNEAYFLPAHLAYHRMIGVERVYLFLDRSTDQSVDIGRRFPGVRVCKVTVRPAGSSYISDFHRLAMDQAMVWAREEGLDWLMILDPDEFAYADNTGASIHESDPDKLCRDADLRILLSSVPNNILQVQLVTREVLPCREWAESFFADQIYFQGNPPLGRSINNPLTGTTSLWENYLGHRQGKCLVRTSAPVQSFDSHRWTTEQSPSRPNRPEFVPIPTISRGWHAHYFITGYDHWLNKYRQIAFEPTHWPCGTAVELPIQTWKEVYAARDRVKLSDYLKNHVFLSEACLQQHEHSGTALRDKRLQKLIMTALQRYPLHPEPLNSVTVTDLSPFEKPVLPEWGPEHFVYSPSLIPASRLKGFYPVELQQSFLFRWSEPSASIAMELPEGEYTLEANLGYGIQPKQARTLSLQIAGQILYLTWIGSRPCSLRSSFKISREQGGSQTLAIKADLLPDLTNDPRRLSLQWLSLNLRRQFTVPPAKSSVFIDDPPFNPLSV